MDGRRKLAIQVKKENVRQVEQEDEALRKTEPGLSLYTKLEFRLGKVGKKSKKRTALRYMFTPKNNGLRLPNFSAHE